MTVTSMRIGTRAGSAATRAGTEAPKAALAKKGAAGRACAHRARGRDTGAVAAAKGATKAFMMEGRRRGQRGKSVGRSG